jgi:hypothetical protein
VIYQICIVVNLFFFKLLWFLNFNLSIKKC